MSPDLWAVLDEMTPVGTEWTADWPMTKDELHAHAFQNVAGPGAFLLYAFLAKIAANPIFDNTIDDREKLLPGALVDLVRCLIPSRRVVDNIRDPAFAADVNEMIELVECMNLIDLSEQLLALDLTNGDRDANSDKAIALSEGVDESCFEEA